jgi:hypothetical protein
MFRGWLGVNVVEGAAEVDKNAGVIKPLRLTEPLETSLKGFSPLKVKLVSITSSL